MQALTSLMIVAALALAPPAALSQPLQGSAEASAFKQLAAAIPLGTRITVRTTQGRRLDATLLAVDDDRIVVKRRSRVPEAAVGVPYEDLAELERREPGGFSVGKSVGIGLAAGVGAILTMFAIAVSIDD
jgi:hypothetical protein